MTSDRRLQAARWLAPILVGVTYVLLVFGSTVRIHDAGLACPDWPMCFGVLVPELDFGIGLEFGHRVLAGLVSLGFLAVGALVLSVRSARPALWPWLLVAALVLALQIVLGGLTVLELLAEWTVTSHLVAGNAFCALLLVLALRLRELSRPVVRAAASGAERVAPFVLLAAVALQLAIGGLVASSHAGLACGPAWPNCGGSAWFPTFEGAVGLQVVHRIGAYIVIFVGVGVVALLWRHPRLRAVASVALGVVLAQATLGVVNVWTAMPAEVTALHSAGAAALVLCTVWICYEAARCPATATISAVAPARMEAR